MGSGNQHGARPRPNRGPFNAFFEVVASCLPLATLGVLLAVPVFAQAPADDPQYVLLQNKFGELCTMCEAIVLCAEDERSELSLASLGLQGSGPYTLYHFQTKTFWGQVATIWDYLIRWIEPVVRERRPVTIYAIPAAEAPPDARNRTEIMARLSLEPPLIETGDRQINRQTRAWQSTDGQPVGYCRRLPLRETWRWLQSQEPWPEKNATATRGEEG